MILNFYKYYIIVEEFIEWIEDDFIKSNHKKYHKYFDEWFNNLTKDQLYYFERSMVRKKDKSMIINN